MQSDGCHIEWRAAIKESHEQQKEKEGWSVVNVDAVGFTNNKNIELTEVEEVHADAQPKGLLGLTRSGVPYSKAASDPQTILMWPPKHFCIRAGQCMDWCKQNFDIKRFISGAQF